MARDCLYEPGRRYPSIAVLCGVLASCGGTSSGRQDATTDRQPSAAATRPGGVGNAASPDVGLLLRPAADARGCSPPHMVADRQAPPAVAAMMSVLRQPRTSIDGLPVLNRTDHRSSDDTGWLAATTLDYRGVRRRRDSNPGIYVVPSATVLELQGERLGAPCPSLLPAAVAAGACLVIGPPGGPFAVACWTLPEIARGHALTLVGDGGSRTLAGLAPSGATLVLTTGTGRSTVRCDDGVIYQPTSLPPAAHLRTHVVR